MVISQFRIGLNRFIIFLVVLWLPIQLLAVELTSEERQYLERTGRVKACVDPDWYPFERINEKGEHEGIAGDLLRLIAKRSGINLEIIKTASWDESIQAIKDNRCQILSFLNQTPQRDEWLLFSEPYFTDVNVFITRNEHSFISDPAILTNETIILPEHTAISELIKRDYPNLKLVHTETENEAFIFVSNNKADMTMRSLIIDFPINNRTYLHSGGLESRITSIRQLKKCSNLINLPL